MSLPVNLKGKKGKEEYLYSAILADTRLTKRSDMDHTVYLQITPCLQLVEQLVQLVVWIFWI